MSFLFYFSIGKGINPENRQNDVTGGVTEWRNMAGVSYGQYIGL